MQRLRSTQIVLAISGLLFLLGAGAYPMVSELWHGAWRLPGHSEITPMFGCLYAVLGVFVLLAIARPAAHRSLIAFAAWSSLAHAAVMAVQWAQAPGPFSDFGVAVSLFVVLGVALLLVMPRTPASAVGTAAADRPVTA